MSFINLALNQLFLGFEKPAKYSKLFLKQILMLEPPYQKLPLNYIYFVLLLSLVIYILVIHSSCTHEKYINKY